MSGLHKIYIVLSCIGVCISVAVDPASMSDGKQHVQQLPRRGAGQKAPTLSFDVNPRGDTMALAEASTGHQLIRQEPVWVHPEVNDAIQKSADFAEDEEEDEEEDEDEYDRGTMAQIRKSRHGKGGDDQSVAHTNTDIRAHDKGRGVTIRFRPLYFMGITCLSLGILVFIAAKYNAPRDTQITRRENLHVKMKPHVLDQDLYGLFASILVRDSKDVICGSDAVVLRASRLAISIVTWVFTMALQVYILVAMDQLVAALAVNHIRVVYNEFELIMHGGDMSKMVQVPFGGIRGKAEDYDVDNFMNMSPSSQSSSCQIALSQPNFLFVILVVWALTCASEVKAAVRFAIRVIYCTPTIQSMKDALEVQTFQTATGESTLHQQKSLENPTVMREFKMDSHVKHEVVVGITRPLKAMLGFAMALRVFVALYLLWIGAYWLLATCNFQEIVFNVVALDFVLLLQHLLYVALVPLRHRREQSATLFQPLSFNAEMVEPPSFLSFFGYYLLLIACIGWVLVYMLVWQTVLPDYQWDVLEACLKHRSTSWGMFHKLW